MFKFLLQLFQFPPCDSKTNEISIIIDCKKCNE